MITNATRNIVQDATQTVMTRRAQPWLGTTVEIAARHRDAVLANRAVDAGFAAIAHVHRAMSPQVVGSDVARINRAAIDQAVRVWASTWRVLRIAEELHRNSHGLFDCAIDGGDDARDSRRPSSRERRSSQRDLDLSRENEVVKRRPLAIDLGGIAKGYAVDAARDALREAGASSACVNAGGDIAVFGDETFAVDVRDPRDPAIRHRLVELRDFAVATSSIQQCNALLTGRYARDVDRSAFDRGASISVLAPRCVVADALTKVVALSGAPAHPLVARCGASALVLGTRHG